MIYEHSQICRGGPAIGAGRLIRLSARFNTGFYGSYRLSWRAVQKNVNAIPYDNFTT